MQTIEAAVLREPETLVHEQVSLDPPQREEVRIDLRATGVCHTDYHFYAGEFDVPLPVVLGHEGAGVVEAVGADVSGVSPGDTVVLSLLPPCGSCRYCTEGRPFLCQAALDVRFTGTLLDGTRRLHADGEPLNHFYAQSSFATQAVVPAASAIPVADAAPFEAVAPLGCGATTGIGAVLKTAAVEPGASVAVFGCGGTGTSAILAAAAVSATEIIAVDIDPERLDRAADLGATTTIDASETDPVARITESTGGVEYAFEFVGNTDTVRSQAVRATEPGGTIVFSGAAAEDATVDVFELIDEGKTLHGNVAGSVRPAVDIPRYVEMYLDGALDLEALVTPDYTLAEAEAALTDLVEGHVLKPVLGCQ